MYVSAFPFMPVPLLPFILFFIELWKESHFSFLSWMLLLFSLWEIRECNQCWCAPNKANKKSKRTIKSPTGACERSRRRTSERVCEGQELIALCLHASYCHSPIKILYTVTPQIFRQEPRAIAASVSQCERWFIFLREMLRLADTCFIQ